MRRIHVTYESKDEDGNLLRTITTEFTVAKFVYNMDEERAELFDSNGNKTGTIQNILALTEI